MPSSLTKLLQLINASNTPPMPVTTQNVELLAPTTAVGATWNTRVTMRAIPGQGFKSEVDVYYRRIPLNLLNNPIEIDRQYATSPQALLDRINFLYNSWLELSDLANFTIPADVPGQDGNLTLTALTGSYGWLGSVPVVLKSAVVVPTFTIQASDAYDQAETNLGTTIIVTLSQPTTAPVSMTLTTQDMTVLEGTHYLGAVLNVTIPPGETVAYANVEVLRECVLPEDGKFKLLVSSLVGATGPAEAIVPVRPGWYVVGYGRVVYDDQDQRVARFTVMQMPLYEAGSAVNWSTSTPTAGTPAVPDVDFAPSDGVITFVPEERFTTIDVVVRSIDPASPVSFALALSGPTNNTTMIRHLGDVILRTDQPILTIAAGETVDIAGEKFVRFPLTLTSAGQMTFSYRTVDGTAVGGTHFTAATEAFGIIGNDGGTDGEILIPILGDIDGALDLYVEIFDESGGRCEHYRARGVISQTTALSIGDAVFEQLPVVPYDAYAGYNLTSSDGVRSARIWIGLDRVADEDVEFQYTTVDGTALAGDGDYTSTSGVATVQAGNEEVYVLIPIREVGHLVDRAFKFQYSPGDNDQVNMLNTEVDITIPRDIPSTLYFFDEFDGAAGTLDQHVPDYAPYNAKWAETSSAGSNMPRIADGSMFLDDFGSDMSQGAEVLVGPNLQSGIISVRAIIKAMPALVTNDTWTIGLANQPASGQSYTGAQLKLDFAQKKVSILGTYGGPEFAIPADWWTVPAQGQRTLEMRLQTGTTLVGVFADGYLIGTHNLESSVNTIDQFKLFMLGWNAPGLEISRIDIDQSAQAPDAGDAYPVARNLEWYAMGAATLGYQAIDPQGTIPDSDGDIRYNARVLGEPTGGISWRKEWTWNGGAPYEPFFVPARGPRPGEMTTPPYEYNWAVEVDPYQLYDITQGEMRCYASVDGVEFADYVWIRWTAGANALDVTWGYTPAP